MNDDTQLMLRVKEGDQKAFREIVEKHQTSILNLCARFIGNQEDAEEIAQDVFIRLLRYADSYQPRAKLSTYLYRIAVNLSLNRVRDNKWKRYVTLDSTKARGRLIDKAVSHSPDQLLEQKEKSEAIRAIVNSLPANQRTAVILKRFEGLSYAEIAEVMKVSVSAVESLLFRAKQTLKKKLQGYASVPE